jgi:hypothetical protein
VVKVSSNTTLLGRPTLNELYTKALHIGLWNSIENDFVMIAACLPSVRPLFKAFAVFTETRLTTLESMRVNSSSESQHSLKANGAYELSESLEPEQNSSRPANRSIQVQYEFSLQRERPEPGEPRVPANQFQVR